MNKSARFGMGEQALAGRFMPFRWNDGVLARPGATSAKQAVALENRSGPGSTGIVGGKSRKKLLFLFFPACQRHVRRQAHMLASPAMAGR